MIANLDEILGLRARWILLYGSLPAIISFFALSFVNSFTATSYLPIHYLLIGILLIVPFIITFVHIKRNLRLWYLRTKYLNIRSITLTVAILALVTVFSFIVLFITQPSAEEKAASNIIPLHVFISLSQYWIKAFILGIISITISSAIISGMLIDKKYYAGLPTKHFEEMMEGLKSSLNTILKHEIWKRALTDDEIEDLENSMRSLKKKVYGIAAMNELKLAKDFYGKLILSVDSVQNLFSLYADKSLSIEKEDREKIWGNMEFKLLLNPKQKFEGEELQHIHFLIHQTI